MERDRVVPDVQELLPDYLADARECLERVSSVLLAVDRGEAAAEHVPELFRQMHVIKGGAGLMGFSVVGAVAHAAEDLLGAAKRGELSLGPRSASALLEAHDALRGLLEELEMKGVTSLDPGRVVASLRSIITEGEAAAPEPPAAPAEEGLRAGRTDSDEEVLQEFFQEARELIDEIDQDLVLLEETPKDKDLLNKIFRAAHTLKGSSSFLGFKEIGSVTHSVEDVFNKLRKDERVLSPDLMDVILEAVDRIRRLLDAARNGEQGPPIDDVLAALTEAIDRGGSAEAAAASAPDDGARVQTAEERSERVLSDAPAPGSAADAVEAKQVRQRGSQAEQTVRVDVERLDALLNLVGELVLGKNRLARLKGQMEERWNGDEMVEQLAETSSQIDLVASDLQLAVMKTRLVPIDKVFRKFPRMVRDLARSLKKEIRLEIQGEGTELDKSVVEVIGDPLVHLIRNAADHGIEAPADRERAGKPREGRISLSACHEGNHIVVTVEDDGKGMDPEALKRKAMEKGILSAQDAAAMTQREALNLIFAPGFSTAASVTSVSGRGVGMDVVKTNIQQVNGVVELDSTCGQGSKVQVRIPLTLAIIQALLVRSRQEVYAVPLVSVVETVRVGPGDVKTVDRMPVLRLRDEVMPLVYLNDLFRVPEEELPETARKYVVVLGIGERRVGLVVEGLVGEEEVVIKNLGTYLSEVPGIAGATIRGDGRVTLIVDVSQILELAARHRPQREVRPAA
ncbi:MAG: chemotaxis protein CheA [Deltaproteobacteria bacterium]|nr:chemotaxis protein CheA [Deltaproteobacteria bacterium]